MLFCSFTPIIHNLNQLILDLLLTFIMLYLFVCYNVNSIAIIKNNIINLHVHRHRHGYLCHYKYKF